MFELTFSSNEEVDAYEGWIKIEQNTIGILDLIFPQNSGQSVKLCFVIAPLPFQYQLVIYNR